MDHIKHNKGNTLAITPNVVYNIIFTNYNLKNLPEVLALLHTEALNHIAGLIAQTRNKIGGQLTQDDITKLNALEKALKQCKPLFERSELEVSQPVENVEYDDEEPEGRVTGPFSRLAKGGVIHGEDEEVFVPEIWVRRLGIEHGDWLAADPLGVLHENMLYEFTVLERRRRGDNPERVSLIGPLLYHSGDWMIFSSEEETTITLNPREVRSLGLREGDLVEVAYMQGDIARARIAWKFDEQTLEEKSAARTKQRSDKPRQTLDVADPLLSGKTIFVVGADLYKESFRQMFERRGANFVWESGFQGGTGRNIEAKVRSANIVVIVTEMMSHRLPDVENMCKRHNKSFVYAPSKGSTGAIREVQQKLRAIQAKSR